MKTSTIILSFLVLFAAVTAVTVVHHHHSSSSSSSHNNMVIPPKPSDDTLQASTIAEQQLIDGVRVTSLKTPSGFLYFWHPNGTMFDDGYDDQNKNVNNDTTPAHAEVAQHIRPQLIIDFSPSMSYGGFKEPAILATAEALEGFRRAGENRKLLNLDLNPIPAADLTTFSGNVKTTTIDFALDGIHHHNNNQQQQQQQKVRSAANAVNGNTRPELAFDGLLSRLVASSSSSFDQDAFIPVVFLTDGEFNGHQQYGQYWNEVAAKIAHSLTNGAGPTSSSKKKMHRRMSIVALGVKHDSLEQIADMKNAFLKHSIPFTYLTSESVSDIPRAFSHAVNMSLEQSAAHVRLTSSTQNNNSNQQQQQQQQYFLKEGTFIATPLDEPLTSFSAAAAAATTEEEEQRQGASSSPRPWDFEKTLLYPDHFVAALRQDGKERRRVILSAADTIVRMRLELEAFRRELAKITTADGEAASAASIKQDLEVLASSVADALVRYQSEQVPPLLNSLTTRVVPCSYFQTRPCTDPNEKMADASPFLSWLQSGVLEHAVFLEMVTSAAQAATEKERFEHVSAAFDLGSILSNVNQTLNDRIDEEAAASVSSSKSSSSSSTTSHSASRTINAEELQNTVQGCQQRYKKNWRGN